MIEDDVRCVRCGTNLRSHNTHGSCPGCDAPVWFSIYGTWLRTAEPGWLRRVRLGVTVWVWVLVVTLLLNVLGFVGLMVVAEFTDDPLQASAELEDALGFGGLLVAALELVAVFLITAREPSTALCDRPVTLRRGLRVLLPIVCLHWLFRFRAPGSLLPMFESYFDVLDAIAIAMVMGLLIYLRRLARRIPHSGLERNTTIACWAIGLTLGAYEVTAVALLSAVWADADLPTAPWWGTWTVCSLHMVGPIFAIWLIVLLTWYRRAIGTAIKTVLRERAAVSV